MLEPPTDPQGKAGCSCTVWGSESPTACARAQFCSLAGHHVHLLTCQLPQFHLQSVAVPLLEVGGGGPGTPDTAPVGWMGVEGGRREKEPGCGESHYRAMGLGFGAHWSLAQGLEVQV